MEEQINYKKSLGQNFIYDKNLLRAIARDGEVSKNDLILEIGAGAGTLTEVLSREAKRVISFEIDLALRDILEQLSRENKNIEFHFQDFMQADIPSLFEGKAKVVANIPYYITTPIIFKLVEHIEKFDLILVLIQKEVAERFSAKPKTKDYGITSVILQSVFDVTMPRVIKKENFTPSPKVDSALCKLVPHDKYEISNFETFKSFVHHSFSMRRKTLVNNLKAYYEKEKIIFALKEFGYKENSRPEEISVKNFIDIYKLLEK